MPFLTKTIFADDYFVQDGLVMVYSHEGHKLYGLLRTSMSYIVSVKKPDYAVRIKKREFRYERSW